MYRWIRWSAGRDLRQEPGLLAIAREEVAGQVEHVLLAGAGRNPHSHGRELEQDRAHGSAPLRQPHGAVRPQPHRSLELHVLQRLSHALIRQPQVTRPPSNLFGGSGLQRREPLPRTFHVTAFFGVLLALQAQSIAAAPTPPSVTTVRATRTAVAPVLDGRDDDDAWRSAPAIDQFLEARPTEGADRGSGPRRGSPTTSATSTSSSARSTRTPTASSACSPAATTRPPPTRSP